MNMTGLHFAGWSESLVIPFITHQTYSKEKPPHTTIYRSCQCPLLWKQYVHTEVLTCSQAFWCCIFCFVFFFFLFFQGSLPLPLSTFCHSISLPRELKLLIWYVCSHVFLPDRMILWIWWWQGWKKRRQKNELNLVATIGKQPHFFSHYYFRGKCPLSSPWQHPRQIP